ncbi:MAG TPA: hypothetical protein VHW04_02015 [Solirubrobacteraceae bacterium]|jgi:hypothetical protein|nr:hypothetical protein [Solirubrobacteraceae bacterium]
MSAEPLRVVAGDRALGGWEALWSRDVWFQSELPHGDLASRLGGEETLRRTAGPIRPGAPTHIARNHI